MSLASLAGERMFFEGDNSSGVSGDLESATSTATNMEARLGHGLERCRRHRAGGWTGEPGAGAAGPGRAARSTGARLADRIEDNLARLLRARRLRSWSSNRREVLCLAHALEAQQDPHRRRRHRGASRSSAGPIVDGRPYADDAFYREIEAYHRAALIAHMNHTSIKLALPVAPVIEEDAWSGPRQPHGLLLPQPPGALPGATVPGTPNGGTTPGQPTYGQPGYGQPPAYGQQPPAYQPPPAYGPPAAPPTYGPPAAPPAGGPPPGADGTAPGGAAAPFTDPSS